MCVAGSGCPHLCARLVDRDTALLSTEAGKVVYEFGLREVMG